MSDKPKDDEGWAGRGFGKTNAESTTRPPQAEKDDEDGWVWE